MIGVKIVLWCLTVVAAWYLSDSSRPRPSEDDLLSASFRLKVLSEDGNSSKIIETGRISLFGQSLAEAAGDTCSAFLSDHKDYTSCVMSIANALRIKRLDILQWILQIAMDHLPTSATTRTRDHELLAILRHCDHWDTNVQLSDSPSSSAPSSVSDGRRRVVCMLGEDIRPHLLLTFASFTTVRTVQYIFFLNRSRQESSNPQWGIPFLSSDAMATIAKKLPPGKEIKATHITMDNDDDISSFLQLLNDCSVVVLPSDEEVALYPAHIWTLLTTTLRTAPSLSRVPIVWISDTVHTTTTAAAAKAAPTAATVGFPPCAPHCDHPFHHTFRWLLQDTWSIESMILSHVQDGEGFPREQYVWPSHHDSRSDGSQHHASQPSHSAQQLTLSSVYLGFMDLLLAAPTDKVIDGATAAHRQPAATPSTKETTIVIITFADRIYAETAWGLHQQLREQLHYPHVLLVPQLSVEIWQYVETYMETWSSTDEASSGSPSSASSASSWTIIQIILTPHMAYGAHLIPSSFSRYGITWQLSYVVVVLEQEWYFQTVQQAFVGVESLLQDAAAVWTFSPVQRDVVHRIYTQQWQEQWHQRETQPPDIVVDVTPIFAPCAPSMPCHIAFEPSPLPSSSTQSHSVGAYELIFFGHDVDGERSRFLAMLQPQLAVALPSLRFSPRMPSILKAHRHRHDTDEAETAEVAAASAAAVDGEEDNEEEDDESLLPLVGRARDVVMLSRSTIALNLRMHTLSVLEMHRLVYLLSMGKCIVSQRGRDPSLTSLPMLEGAVYFVDTVDDVVATLQFLLTPTDDYNDTVDTGTGKADATGLLPLSTKAVDWIVQAHGQYQRLARCEQRSLAAYRAIHTLYNQTTMKTASVPTTGNVDESIEPPQLMYSTVALERVMQRLLLSHQRRATT